MANGLVHDRRRVTPSDGHSLRSCLNEAQCGALRALEYFGWTLRFVRNPSAPIPVMFATDNTFLVIRADGSIDDRTKLAVRKQTDG
ncbi:hypothetical protein [Lysobacter sp. A289]